MSPVFVYIFPNSYILCLFTYFQKQKSWINRNEDDYYMKIYEKAALTSTRIPTYQGYCACDYGYEHGGGGLFLGAGFSLKFTEPSTPRL